MSTTTLLLFQPDEANTLDPLVGIERAHIEL